MIKNIEIDNFKCFDNIQIETKLLNILTGFSGSGKTSFLEVLYLLTQEKLSKITYNYFDKTSICKDSNRDTILFTLNVNNKILGYKFSYNKQTNKLEPKGNTLDNITCLREELLGFNYLKKDRITPKINHKLHYATSVFPEFGLNGEYIISHLIKEKDLLVDIDFWLNKVTRNIKVNVQTNYKLNRVKLEYKFNSIGYTKLVKPEDLNPEISYYLLLVCCLLLSSLDDILVIEYPEYYLSIESQKKLVELLIITANRGVQLFIETKSKSITDLIKRYVMDETIHQDDVNILEFNNQSNYCRINNKTLNHV